MEVLGVGPKVDARPFVLHILGRMVVGPPVSPFGHSSMRASKSLGIQPWEFVLVMCRIQAQVALVVLVA
jgi:hypothetical protein